MECAHADAQSAEQTFDTGCHFPRGFVGKRQSENLIRLYSALQQSHDPMRKDSRFSGTRTGEHEQRSFKMLDGFLLSIGQTGVQDRGIDRHSLSDFEDT
jgi:hypothetical protein